MCRTRSFAADQQRPDMDEQVEALLSLGGGRGGDHCLYVFPVGSIEVSRRDLLCRCSQRDPNAIASASSHANLKRLDTWTFHPITRESQEVLFRYCPGRQQSFKRFRLDPVEEEIRRTAH